MLNVQTLLDEALIKRSENWPKSKEPKFHISDAGKCYRQRYFKRLGVERLVPMPLGGMRKGAAGDAAHEKITSLLDRGVMAAERYLETEHIRGRFDTLIKDKEGNKALIQIKSTEKWQLGHIKTKGPSAHDELQLFTEWTLAREDYKDLDQAILFYVKREDFQGVAYDYQWSEEIKKKVEQDFKPLIAYWLKQELPPCTCHQDYDGKGPDYCMYKEVDEVTGETIGCCNEKLMTEVEVAQEKTETATR